MFGRFLGAGVAIVLVALLAMPFGREIYYRYQVWQHLDTVADAPHRAAFEEWNGSARSFQQQLGDRCREVYGATAPACDRYRPAAD